MGADGAARAGGLFRAPRRAGFADLPLTDPLRVCGECRHFGFGNHILKVANAAMLRKAAQWPMSCATYPNTMVLTEAGRPQAGRIGPSRHRSFFVNPPGFSFERARCPPEARRTRDADDPEMYPARIVATFRSRVSGPGLHGPSCAAAAPGNFGFARRALPRRRLARKASIALLYATREMHIQLH